MNKKTRRIGRSPVVETLENRQLLHAVVDVRLTGGGQAVVVDHVGQVVNFDVFVTVTGDNGTGSDDGLQTMSGSFLSSDITGGAALGNLQLTTESPFTSAGPAQNGVQADLDSDTDLDIGSNDDTQGSNMFAARSAQVETTSGTVSGASNTFKIGTGTFTITSLLTGVQTNLAFRPRNPALAPSGFLFKEDGNLKNGTNGGVVVAGASITLKRPGAASINGRVFNDKNATGFFDGNDEGISGFRVFLDTDFDGVLDAGEVSKPVSTTGTYHFTGIDAGTYRVREVFRSGWRQSFPALGYYQVTLKYGEAAKTQSFANTDTIVIKGKVWNDSNKDGVINNGEGGIPGWMLYIDHNNNSVLDKGDDWTLSDSNGNYRFSNLPAGTYHVGAVPVSTWRATAPSSGFRTITLGPAGTASNKNFGEKRLK